MHVLGFVAILTTLLQPGDGAPAAPSQLATQVGDTYEITLTRDSSRQSSDGASSGSSHDQDAIIERVTGLRADGLELEYDVPKDIPAEARVDIWQFPARVFRPFRGPPQLLNRTELGARVEAWLKAAKLPRTACGHWVFTWNAFRIECDPDSVLKTLNAFDLRSLDLRAGAPYREAGAGAPAPLSQTKAGPGGATFTARMEVDPDAVRRDRAEADVVVGEITRKPLTFDAALRERAKEAVSGTITVTFDTDAAGNVRRRTKVTRIETRKPDGRLETDIITNTVERRLLHGRAAPERKEGGCRIKSGMTSCCKAGSPPPSSPCCDCRREALSSSFDDGFSSPRLSSRRRIGNAAGLVPADQHRRHRLGKLRQPARRARRDRIFPD